MLIINADDFGRSAAETDAAVRCWRAGRITSVSAMVFMADSKRAAELARENDLEAGLHLNFTEEFTAPGITTKLANCHNRIVRFLRRNKYSQLFYNPFLRREFSYTYQAQADEFARLFGQPPLHIDGHHHMHLCANLLFSKMIPAGTKMRRNFSFWAGEKSWLNRTYRMLVDRRLAQRYHLTDYFFDLTQCIEKEKFDQVLPLARSGNVELMTHPIIEAEENYLFGDEFSNILRRLAVGSYALV